MWLVIKEVNIDLSTTLVLMEMSQVPLAIDKSVPLFFSKQEFSQVLERTGVFLSA